MCQENTFLNCTLPHCFKWKKVRYRYPYWLKDSPSPCSHSSGNGTFLFAFGGWGAADPGCSSWIPVPDLFHPGSRIQGSKLHRIRILNPDPQKVTEYEFKYIKPKKLLLCSQKYGPDQDFFHPGPRVKKTPDPDPQHRADEFYLWMCAAASS